MEESMVHVMVYEKPQRTIYLYLSNLTSRYSAVCPIDSDSSILLSSLFQNFTRPFNMSACTFDMMNKSSIYL